jgi:hypothetical protein
MNLISETRFSSVNLDPVNYEELEAKYGLNAPELTEVIIGFENVLNVIRYGFTIVEEVLDNFWDAKFVSIFPLYFADGVKEAASLVKEKGISIRIITEANEDNLEPVKQISSLFEVRHLSGITGNFGLLDRKQYVVAMFSAYEKPPEQAFFSNSKSFVEQQQYIFDTLWEKAIPARIKIRQIELANELDFTRSISSKEVRDILMDHIECSVKSILIFLPGDEVVKWINEQYVFEGLHAATLRGVEVRIIMDQAAGKGYFDEWFKHFSIQLLLSSVPNTHLDIIVDYKFTLSINADMLGNDNKVGTYSNIEARAMVSSSIFENYWIKSTGLK